MKHQTLSHQTLSKCTFYSNHQLSIAVFIFCWGVISDHPIIQPFGIAWTICLTIFSHPRCQKSKTTHWPRLTAWLLQCCGDTKSIHFGKPWGPRPRPEGCFGWKNHDFEKSSKNFLPGLCSSWESLRGCAWEQCDPSFRSRNWRSQNLGTPWREAMRKWPLICGKSLDLRGPFQYSQNHVIQRHSNKDETTPSRLK